MLFHGPVAAFVDGVALLGDMERLIASGSRESASTSPRLPQQTPATIGQEAARCAEVRHDMAQKSFAYRVRGMIAGRH